MDMSLRNRQEWWWTMKPVMLQSLGSQRVGHNWVTELNWCFLLFIFCHIYQNTGLPSAWEPKGCPSTQRQELWTFHLLIPGWPWASHLNLFFKFSIYKTRLPLNLLHCSISWLKDSIKLLLLGKWKWNNETVLGIIIDTWMSDLKNKKKPLPTFLKDLQNVSLKDSIPQILKI